MRFGGRAGDIKCCRCGRPMAKGQSWRRTVRGREEHYCAEDVIIFDNGQSWRPRTEKDPDDLPAMNDHVQVAAAVLEQDSATPEIPEETWADRADVVLEQSEPATPDDFDPINDVGF